MDEWTIFLLLYWAFCIVLLRKYEQERRQRKYEQRRLEYSRKRMNTIRNLEM